MPASRVDWENNVSGNASWQRGYITLVNLKLTSEQVEERETTDSVLLQNLLQTTRADFWKLICHLTDIRRNYFKGWINVTAQIGYCNSNNSLSPALWRLFFFPALFPYAILQNTNRYIPPIYYSPKGLFCLHPIQQHKLKDDSSLLQMMHCPGW